jgi:hypothetical protein
MKKPRDLEAASARGTSLISNILVKCFAAVQTAIRFHRATWQSRRLLLIKDVTPVNRAPRNHRGPSGQSCGSRARSMDMGSSHSGSAGLGDQWPVALRRGDTYTNFRPASFSNTCKGAVL